MHSFIEKLPFNIPKDLSLKINESKDVYSDMNQDVSLNILDIIELVTVILGD